MFYPPTRLPKPSYKNWRLKGNSYSFLTRQTRNCKSKKRRSTRFRSRNFSIKRQCSNHCANSPNYKKLGHFRAYNTGRRSNIKNCAEADTCNDALSYELSKDVFRLSTECVHIYLIPVYGAPPPWQELYVLLKNRHMLGNNQDFWEILSGRWSL